MALGNCYIWSWVDDNFAIFEAILTMQEKLLTFVFCCKKQFWTMEKLKTRNKKSELKPFFLEHTNGILVALLPNYLFIFGTNRCLRQLEPSLFIVFQRFFLTNVIDSSDMQSKKYLSASWTVLGFNIEQLLPLEITLCRFHTFNFPCLWQ